MTVDEVRQRVADVAAMAGDPECAHSALDQLLISVLRAIADGCKNPKAIAAEALKADELDFPRWYA